MINLSEKTVFELLLKAFLLGVAHGLLYDGMRFVKMLCGVKYFPKAAATPLPSRAGSVLLYAVTFIFDVVFWIVFGISAVLLFYNVSGGVFRASVFPAMLLGLLLYYISIGRIMLSLSSRLVVLLGKICRLAARILSVPLFYAKKILFSLYHLTIGKILGRIKKECYAHKKTRKDQRARCPVRAAERGRANMEKDRTEARDESASLGGELGGSLKSALKIPLVKVILRLIPALLLVASIAMFITGIMKYDELQRKKNELEARAENIEYEIDELEYLLDCPVDYDYIVRVARDKLGLHLPNEIVYYNDVND